VIVGTPVAVRLGVVVGTPVAVRVGVRVGETVRVAVNVRVGVRVRVNVRDGVAVGATQSLVALHENGIPPTEPDAVIESVPGWPLLS
jgi:hypothetical protein